MAAPLQPARSSSWHAQRVLVVGVGGLGCPAALALVQAGVGHVRLCDDDVVDETNLHRQILFQAGDVGRSKLDVAVVRLTEHAASSGSTTQIEGLETRLLPENARLLLQDVDVVIEGADNYATKFLVADACHLLGIPVVHSAAVRWQGTVWPVSASGAPCYRCLFEDLPSDADAPNCESAGVMGAVVGLVGALAAEQALAIVGRAPRFGALYAFDGWRDRLRVVPVFARPGCPLCSAERRIGDLYRARYKASCSAA